MAPSSPQSPVTWSRWTRVSTIITGEPVQWTHPAEQALASSLIGSASENPVNWPVGSDFLLKSPQRFPESPKYFCSADSLHSAAPGPFSTSEVPYPPHFRLSPETLCPSLNQDWRTSKTGQKPSPLHLYLTGGSLRPSLRAGVLLQQLQVTSEAPLDVAPEAVAQVEALESLENSFLDNSHSLATLGQVDLVPWADAFASPEDDLDLRSFSLPELPLQTKDVPDAETEPV